MLLPPSIIIDTQQYALNWISGLAQIGKFD